MNEHNVWPRCHGDGWIPDKGDDRVDVPCPVCNTLKPPRLSPDFMSYIKLEDEE